jgi:4-amino-4-deoxy-L-arabinose transferase-like glycosyltransferase
LLAAIVVATTPLYLVFARTVIFDMSLAFFVCGAIFAGYLAETTDGKSRRNWYLLGAAAAGLATLVKGPVGFVVPILVLLIYNRVDQRRGAWRRLFSPLNLALFFAVTLPWFIGLCLVRRDFLHYGLVVESLGRFTSSETIQRSAPFYFFPAIVLGTFFPWSILLPEASVAAWKENWLNHPGDRLCVIWSIVVVVFFSLSQSKLPHYILSVTVSSGILMARLFDTALINPEGRAARVARRAAVVFLVLCLALAAAVLVGMSWTQLLAKPLRITERDAGQLGHGALPLAVLLLVLGAVSWMAWRRRSVWLAFLCFTLFAPLGANAGIGAIHVLYEARSGRRMAEKLSSVPGGTELVCYQCFPNGLSFYLGRPVTVVSLTGQELSSGYVVDRLGRDPNWPKQFMHLGDFNDWFATNRASIYLIVRDSDRARVEAIGRERGASVENLPPGFLGVYLPARPGS